MNTGLVIQVPLFVNI
ncbi:MAG: hypothetical protein LBC61_02735 [Candidatus Peribacteria bacterium]|nr:hypothetical protein [Candidatus Peribacteria bacterium]